MPINKPDDMIAHWTEIEGGDINHYEGSDELLSLTASFAYHFNLTRLGIHHERLKPGRRVSWPHAEADEEEFVFVIEGAPDLWVDGELRRLKEGDGVGFPSATGIAHTFINNTDKDVRLLVIGEPSRQRSRVHYPLHPKRNEEIGERHWKINPPRKVGSHDGLPDALRKKR